MRRVDDPTRERWFALLDADIERILEGDEPKNVGLTGLTSPISDLRAMAFIDIDEDRVTDLSRQAANLVPERLVREPRRPRLAGFVARMRARVAAGTATLVMVSGLAGVAVASDAAVPGDWNYGIDVALEAVGIGAGGAEERLLELRETGGDPYIGLNPAITTGTELAADQVLSAGSEQSLAVREQVSTLHEYISSTDKVNGSIVSEIARDINGAGRPDHALGNGPPEHVTDPGKPEHAGQGGAIDPNPGSDGNGQAKGRP